MPDPMHRWPTVQELRERVTRNTDVTVEANRLSIDGVEYFVLKRIINGQAYRHPMPFPEDEPLAPTMMRNLCDKLRLDVREVTRFLS